MDKQKRCWTCVDVVSIVVRHGKHSTTRRHKILVCLFYASHRQARSAKHKRERSEESAADRGQMGSGNAWAHHCTANAKGDCRTLPRHYWTTARLSDGARILRFLGRTEEAGDSAEHLRFLSRKGAAFFGVAR